MGCTIKNYEKKRRKERKEAYKEVREVVSDVLAERFGFSREMKEKQKEMVDLM